MPFVPDRSAGRFVPDTTPQFDPLREIALQGRSAAQGVFNTLAAIPDATIMAMNAGTGLLNRYAGTNIPQAETYGQTFSRALDEAGAYRPETKGEKMRTAGTQGVTSTLSGLGLANSLLNAGNSYAQGTGQFLATNPIQQTVAGTAAPIAGELARQHGAGPWTQFGIEALTAGLIPGDQSLSTIANIARQKDVGGLIRSTGSAIRNTGAGAGTAPVGRGVKGAAEAATAEGRGNIVGRILREVSTDPEQAVVNLDNRPQTIINPTTAQVANDVGLMRAENVVGKTMDRTNRLADRRMEANTQLQNKFEGLLPLTAAEAEAKRGTLNAAAQSRLDRIFEGRATPDLNPVNAKIEALLASPVGQRQEVRTALEYAQRRLLEWATGPGPKDPRAAYAIRQDITDLMNGRLKGAADRAGQSIGTTRVSRLARGVLDNQVLAELDNAIESVVPGFKDYLAKYSSAAQRVDRRALIGELRQKAETTATDAAGEFNLLSAAQMNRALQNRAKEVGTKLTPKQQFTLNSITADLERGAKTGTAAVQGRGSDTLTAVSGGATVANIIGRAMSGPPTRQTTTMAGSLIAKTKIFDWMFGLTDREIHDTLVAAMLDPDFASVLLKRANEEALQTASQRLQDIATRRGALASVTRDLTIQE